MTVTRLIPRPRTTGAADWKHYGACVVPRDDGLDPAQMTTDAEDSVLLGTYQVTFRDPVTRRDVTVTRDWDDDLDEVRAMCHACPVLDRCRADALHRDSYAGVVAALTERERQEWRDRHGITVETLRHAVLVPRTVTRCRDGRLVEVMAWVLDLSTETRASGQRAEITAEELVVVARLTSEGWTVEDIADRLVTVRAAGEGSETVTWNINRVWHAHRILAGSQGSDARRPA